MLVQTVVIFVVLIYVVEEMQLEGRGEGEGRRQSNRNIPISRQSEIGSLSFYSLYLPPPHLSLRMYSHLLLPSHTTHSYAVLIGCVPHLLLIH